MNNFKRLMLGRLDDEAFCRRLTLEGWDRLVTADDGTTGVVLVSPGTDLWPVTVAAVGLYRGPLDLAARESRLRELPARWRRRFVRRVIDPEDASGPASESLRDGGRVVVLGGPEDGGSLAVRLSEDTGASVLSVVADSPRRGRYRIAVRPLEDNAVPALTRE
jgi:lauroyl/myristoyl acyltransferase